MAETLGLRLWICVFLNFRTVELRNWPSEFLANMSERRVEPHGLGPRSRKPGKMTKGGMAMGKFGYFARKRTS